MAGGTTGRLGWSTLGYLLKDQDFIERIFLRQKPGGYWGEPENFYVYSKYKGTIWNLILLAELGANREDPRIRNACEFVFTWSQHRESGGFAFHGTAEKGGEADCIIPCLTGNMVWCLLKFDYWNDFHLQKGIEWITTYQRLDDGECRAPKGFPYQNEHCWGKHTCMIGVVKALRALVEITPALRIASVQQTINRSIDYLLLHQLFRRSHAPSMIANDDWLKLGFPHMANTDILEMLALLKKLNIRDERMKPAMEALRSQRQEDGFWLNENSKEGRMAVIVDRQGQPSPWITQSAIDVLDWWDNQGL